MRAFDNTLDTHAQPRPESQQRGSGLSAGSSRAGRCVGRCRDAYLRGVMRIRSIVLIGGNSTLYSANPASRFVSSRTAAQCSFMNGSQNRRATAGCRKASALFTVNSPVASVIYARTSTTDQTCENQLIELRRYVQARGWAAAVEYVDHGVSGSKDRRPALDRMMADAKRRKIDVVICWKLDRFGRSLTHLVNAIQTLTDAGVGFTSIGEGIDTHSATGLLMLGILASFAEFEKSRIRERVLAGLQRAKAQGKRLGTPRTRPAKIEVPGGTVRDAAKAWGVSKSTAARWIAVGRSR